jgi:hypothetical protein
VAKQREAVDVPDALEALERLYDQRAYDRMLVQEPMIAAQIEEAVNQGYTPKAIRQQTERSTGSEMLANWSEQAARWLVGA